MPAYQSSFDATSYQLLSNLSLLPLRTTYKGPAPKADSSTEDVIDEAFKYYRANVFFKQFEIKTPADRVLIYVTLFIQACLAATMKCNTANEAKKQLNSLALTNFSIPGDPSFPLNSLYSSPKNHSEAETLRQFFQQIRSEVVERFVPIVFKDDKPDKWWMCLAKRKFMNTSID
ncbi:actin-related protein 2/3 complex subunit 3-like [Zophobas morio]|uniref:actin-related protein 2/3 complex subunit 3-like n=1 Tax=Zophobas morio TaxID=2755281 RepID=UPI0030837E6C